MRFLSVNLDALLVELDDLPQTLSLLAALRADPVEGIEEIVPAARTLRESWRREPLVRYGSPPATSHRLPRRRPSTGSRSATPSVR